MTFWLIIPPTLRFHPRPTQLASSLTFIPDVLYLRAIGNLIDRVRIGKVIDFIHVHYADVWHYPIFNVADIAICVGVAIVVIDMLFLEGKRNAKYQA